jgi:hypothetical protein
MMILSLRPTRRSPNPERGISSHPDRLLRDRPGHVSHYHRSRELFRSLAGALELYGCQGRTSSRVSQRYLAGVSGCILGRSRLRCYFCRGRFYCKRAGLGGRQRRAFWPGPGSCSHSSFHGLDGAPATLRRNAMDWIFRRRDTGHASGVRVVEGRGRAAVPSVAGK